MCALTNCVHAPSLYMQVVQSQLKWQTRCVSCFPDKLGYLVGSIEGRVSVQHVDDQQVRCMQGEGPGVCQGPVAGGRLRAWEEMGWGATTLWAA